MLSSLLIGLFVSCSIAGLPTQSDPADSLAHDLRKAQRDNAGSYQRFLRQSYHLTVKALDGREFKLIEPKLKAQSFRFEDNGTEGSSHRYMIKLTGLGFRPIYGPRHDL